MMRNSIGENLLNSFEILNIHTDIEKLFGFFSSKKRKTFRFQNIITIINIFYLRRILIIFNSNFWF